MVHPKVKDFRDKLTQGKKRARPKESENIFTTWAAVGRGMGVGHDTVWKWSKLLPKPPHTRQFLEQWRRERIIGRYTTKEDMSEVVRYRLILRVSDHQTAKALGFDHFRRIHRVWKLAMKHYTNIRPPGAPETREEADALWKKLRYRTDAYKRTVT